MKTKAKLLTVKEARAKVKSLEYKVYDLELGLNKAQNELISMTGARDNCMTMMKHYRLKDSEKKTEIADLISTVQSQSRNLNIVQDTVSVQRKELAVYRTESAGALIERGLKLFIQSVKNDITNFVARLRFKRAK